MINLFDGLATGREAERFDDLLARPGLRIERIVSTGQATQAGTWLDQPWDEWVLVVAGGAVLAIEGAPERRLECGDHLLIPAGTRHRVASTDRDRPTVWLAVHIGEPQG